MQRPDREAIMKAISELDRIGRSAFMERYGFADRNLTYEAEHAGKCYPSKAIFGAAFGFMPGGKARNSAQCNGTEAREHLKKLGFKIVGAKTGGETSGTAPKVRLNRTALEELRSQFLALHPDFRTFADCPSFAEKEDGYKRALIAQAAQLVQEISDDQALGGALLDLALGKGGFYSNLIDWRAAALVEEIRSAHTGIVEQAVAAMIAEDEPFEAVITWVDTCWPFMTEGRSSKPYAESRMVPTMIMALLNPAAMMGIRSTPTNNAHAMLMGNPAFTWDRLTREELQGVLAMAGEIQRIMREEWNWAPRDLWDVQSFIWETCQKQIAAPTNNPSGHVLNETSQVPSMSEPTNLILYGPPGTGKTYTTAREALRLCGEDVSLARFPNTEKGRKALMDRYNQLRKDERIGFVTFHQSYAYEDFVEGLRPVPIESEAGPPSGFELKPHDGIFKKMAARAAMTRAGADGFVLGDRRVFKMSLGYIGDPANDYVFEDAIEQGHIRLGYDPIDFSDDKFADVEEIIAACKAFDLEHPGQNSTPPTGNSGRVQCPKIFRNWMQIGDIVVVPMGNSFFRAIGEITGDYEFDADVSAYVHKRAVRWLWSDPEGKPVEEIYDKKFTMQSVYALGKDLIKPEGLARFINSNSVPSDAPLLPHVLIIDEINRGNVSKIFGELITLIEPDKRAGMTNALTVTLPYSPGDFTVPANLHIIGTMNTADRSIALLDTALRRRFTFREIAPDPSLLGTVGGVDLKALLTTINNRIEYLIDREHRIGHAFFMGCTDRASVDGVMRDKVIPLLQEYFFEDWSRVQAVLGRGFIGKISLKRPPGIEDYHPETKDSWFVRWNRDENGKEAVYPYGFPDDAYNLLLGQPASDAGQQNQGE